MRRAAFAVLLSFCVPLLLFGQHRGGGEGGGASSGGGSSSGGYSGSSGSSETYHSSSSGGGSSSSSGSSSGSYSSSSGSSHSSSSGSSSGPGSGNASGGSSGGSHSNSGGGSSFNALLAQEAVGDRGPARRAVRLDRTSDTGTWIRHRTPGPGVLILRVRICVTAVGNLEPNPSLQVANANWTQQVPRFRLEQQSGGTLGQALRAGSMNAELSKLGLEPNKKAYEDKLAALRAERQRDGKSPNWFARVILGKQDKRTGLQASAGKPCVGDNCRPAPKPCAGNTCRPVPPCKGNKCQVPPPTTCLISEGSRSSGCGPWGYIERCDDGQGTCYAHLVRVNASDCDEIRKRLQNEETLASRSRTAQQTACSTTAATAECSTATSDYQREELRIEQLRKQYQLCMMAANP